MLFVTQAFTSTHGNAREKKLLHSASKKHVSGPDGVTPPPRVLWLTHTHTHTLSVLPHRTLEREPSWFPTDLCTAGGTTHKQKRKEIKHEFSLHFSSHVSKKLNLCINTSWLNIPLKLPYILFWFTTIVNNHFRITISISNQNPNDTTFAFLQS